MRNIGFSLMLVCISQFAQGQTTTADRKRMIDSIRMSMIREYAKTYNLLRQVSISNDVVGNTTSRLDLYKKQILTSKVFTNRTQANINLPLLSWQRNVISVNLNYAHQYLNYTSRYTGTGASATAVPDQQLNTNTYGFSASYVRSDSLFHLPVTLSGTVTGLTGETGSIQKMSYMANLVFNFKRTATTSISAGGLLLIDPSLNVPFIPVFSYWHRFSGSRLEFIADLPQRVLLRKQFNARNWATVGSEIASSVAFLNLSTYQLPRETNFSTFELKNGFTFEHLFTRHLVAGISTGLFTTVSSRLFSTSDKSNDYFISNKNHIAPYVNVSLSLLPFLQPLFR